MESPPLTEYNPMHPGEFIKVTFYEPLDISINQLSEMLSLDLRKTKMLINGQVDVTPELATLLSNKLGRSKESWLMMQNQHDLWHETR